MLQTWIASTLLVTDVASYTQTTQRTTHLLHAVATRQVPRYGERE
jgi:KaiC/GvpD/RAD55 family RecA-like ATPase